MLFSFISKKDAKCKACQPSKKDIMIILPIVCFIVGFYDGFFCSGAGSILILALHFLIHMPLIESSATSKIFNLSSNIGAFIAFFIAVKMVFIIGIPMVLASISGNYIGSHMMLKNGDNIIKSLIFTSIAILFI